MRVSCVCTLLGAAGLASAEISASPFFMFSTSELLTQRAQLRTASSITSDLSSILSTCPSDFYILVSQPGVTSDDYQDRRTTPFLAQRLSEHPESIVHSSNYIPQVVGDIDTAAWQKVLHEKCDVQTTEVDATTGAIPSSLDMLPRLLNVRLPEPSPKQRQQDLMQNDAIFASILDMIPSESFTVLYTTSSRSAVDSSFNVAEGKQYEMDETFEHRWHSDLKRDLSGLAKNTSSNQTMIDGPLFHKYQFFTPGIFMGFLVGFLLLMILYVAISALSSLQVTYAAFDKETGQLAGKKSQ